MSGPCGGTGEEADCVWTAPVIGGAVDPADDTGLWESSVVTERPHCCTRAQRGMRVGTGGFSCGPNRSEALRRVAQS
ncbi:hypothetical protein NDU88_003006 [Pleurodeles waltl]|uniref:Uncharacterized protein n=1 Tax=Pleurodeles waltl TaxID=8319 RepID=A0AAV7WR44_PLEWA|nr:hypothetical protein NDU88_003006 [Pleurodeles waltl]